MLRALGGFSATVVSLLLATAAAADEPPPTPADRARVEARASELQRTCQAVGEQQKRENPMTDPTGGAMGTELKRFIDEVQNGYCDCIGDSVRRDMTPSLLQPGSEQKAYEFLKTRVKACGATAFKQSWPKTCGTIVKVFVAAGGSPAKVEHFMSEACACVQPHVDAITGDNWGQVLQQYQADNSRLQTQPTASIAPSKYSILGPLQACLEQAKQHAQRAPAKGAP